MKVGIAADHGGYQMKQQMLHLLSARGHAGGGVRQHAV